MRPVMKQEVETWTLRAQELGSTHLIVIYDIWHGNNVPVYVKPNQNLQEIKDKYNSNILMTIVETIPIGQSLSKISYNNNITTTKSSEQDKVSMGKVIDINSRRNIRTR